MAASKPGRTPCWHSPGKATAKPISTRATSPTRSHISASCASCATTPRCAGTSCGALSAANCSAVRCTVGSPKPSPATSIPASPGCARKPFRPKANWCRTSSSSRGPMRSTCSTRPAPPPRPRWLSAPRSPPWRSRRPPRKRMPETRHSVCALDCPDCCSLLVTVENGRGTRLRGDPAHPVTRGFLCGKVAQYLERDYSPGRLLSPQRRVGAKGEGRFERISWDEALDAIALRLKAIAAEVGPEAILPYSYAGTMGLLNGAGMDRRFFHRLGASRLDRTICSSAGEAGLTEALGLRYGTEPEQFRHFRLIIAWGANILCTNVHLWPFVMEARRKGAKLYTIDSRRNRTGAAADKHFFINPGSDTALALAMMHVIAGENLHDADYVARHTEGFEELRRRVREWTPQRAAELTGLAAEEIVALAREYATTRPAAIRLNYGIQRSERGAMAVRAVALLPVLVGSWKEAGGGLQLSTSQAFHLNRAGLERADLEQQALGLEARMVNMPELGRALTTAGDPPVEALVGYNSNPAAIAPNQNAVLGGLRRADLFTVVLEQFQNDTADSADYLLPVTTFLEHTDLYLAYGHYYLQLARPALPAPGEARSNVEIFRLLAARKGG